MSHPNNFHNQEENDNEYEESASDSDDVDSDFDIDENDEVISADEDEDGKKRARGRLVTKAYQEPKKKPSEKKTVKRAVVKRKVVETKEDATEESVAPKKERRTYSRTVPKISEADLDDNSSQGRTSFRRSTTQKREETQKRHKQAVKVQEARKKHAPQKGEKYRQLTQEELLKEAKKTEAENLKSLEKYRLLELEKAKKTKVVKQGIQGPFIRTISTSMPLITEVGDDDSTQTQERASRNFVMFSTDELFRETFKAKPPPVAKKPSVCPISHLRARYYDPVTKLPFSTAVTFRALREAYCKQLEVMGDTRNPEVAAWINWRKQNAVKPQAPTKTPNTTAVPPS